MSNLLKKVTYLFIFSILFFSSCQKEQLEPGVENSPQLENKFLKSSLPDLYVKGEDIPEIIASVDQSLKGGELEERNGNQLPFKFLGYDKSRALKVYNDSFEITSYAFLAYTDITDLNKVVNIVVTQKKNGKPGKPYLYEYTFIKHPQRIPMHLATIVKYKINGVKVDIPGANFNPCIDVICDQYNNPIGGGGTSGSGGSSGGGTGGTGGTSGTGGTGGYTSCQTFIDEILIGPSSYMQVKTTYCSDGTVSTTISYHGGYAFTDCCDSENVSIGVISSDISTIELDEIYPPIKTPFSKLTCSSFNWIKSGNAHYATLSGTQIFLGDESYRTTGFWFGTWEIRPLHITMPNKLYDGTIIDKNTASKIMAESLNSVETALQQYYRLLDIKPSDQRIASDYKFYLDNYFRATNLGIRVSHSPVMGINVPISKATYSLINSGCN